MNWIEIKNKYPKAWIKFIEKHPYLEINNDKLGHYFTDGVHTVQLWNNYNLRDLYYFFDDNEIFICITPEVHYTREIDENDNNPYYCIEDWYYEIYCNNYEFVMDVKIEPNQYNSRIKAEIAAFKKAFEILENKLNDITNE